MDSILARNILDQRRTALPRGLYTVATTLRHFAIITYAIPPERLRAHIPPVFTPHLIRIDGQERALISVVPFLDHGFHFIHLPFGRRSFAQTNYRAYVRYGGEECAWFFGTSVATSLVQIPRQLWQLPWLPAKTLFSVAFNSLAGHYDRYVVRTTGSAGAEVVLEDSGDRVELLPGFDSMPEQELILCHPVRGYFFRRDGRLGTYRIWHDRLQPTRGKVVRARYDLLAYLGLLTPEEATHPYSVMIQPKVDFLIGLPPRCLPIPADDT